MKTFSSHTASTTHSPQLIFSHWADPTGWPEWDAEVREASFEGPARLGAHGKMHPASGPATRFSITAFEQDRVFTNASSLPGATLVFEHRAIPVVDGTQVEVSVGVDGVLAPLWRRVLGKRMGDAARSSVTGLIAHLDAA